MVDCRLRIRAPGIMVLFQLHYSLFWALHWFRLVATVSSVHPAEPLITWPRPVAVTASPGCPVYRILTCVLLLLTSSTRTWQRVSSILALIRLYETAH